MPGISSARFYLTYIFFKLLVAKDYNSCTLHKLVYPDTKGGKWYLTEVKRFQDEE